MDKKVAPQDRPTISLIAIELMTTPINYLLPNDVMCKGYSEDKITKVSGEDQSGQPSLSALKFICLTNKYHWGKLISHCTKRECLEVW